MGGRPATWASSGVVNNATLVINRSNAITLAQDISGSGALTKPGAGTATLTGTNTYTGHDHHRWHVDRERLARDACADRQ